MAINNYITLDGCRYKTSAVTWAPKFERAVQIKRLFSGNKDVSFGPSGMTTWEGDVIAPVTPAANYGSIDELRALYSENTTQVFIDHYGNSYNVVLYGTIAEKSRLRVWDAASNQFLVPVVLVMISPVVLI